MSDAPVSASTPLPGQAAGRSPAFDGVRGVAILLVVFGHGFFAFLWDYAYLGYFLPIWNVAGTGVRIFFVLSGYLITRLLMRELAETGTISLWSFYWRRTIRIFPALYAFLAVMAALWAAGRLDVSPTQFAGALTFTWNYLGVWAERGPDAGEWCLGHLWSLSLEEQFYLLWPLALVAAGVGRAYKLALAIVLGMPLVRFGWYWAFPAQRGYLEVMLHTSLDGIVVGCAAAMALALARDALAPRLARPIVVVTSAAALLYVSPMVSFGLAFYGSGAYGVLVGSTVQGIAAALLIMHLEVCPDGRLARICSWRPLVALGAISYSLYLWQQVFLTHLNPLVDGVVTGVVLSLAAATASYWLVERPFQRLRDHPWGRAARPAAVSPEPERV